MTIQQYSPRGAILSNRTEYLPAPVRSRNFPITAQNTCRVYTNNALVDRRRYRCAPPPDKWHLVEETTHLFVWRTIRIINTLREIRENKSFFSSSRPMRVYPGTSVVREHTVQSSRENIYGSTNKTHGVIYTLSRPKNFTNQLKNYTAVNVVLRIITNARIFPFFFFYRLQYKQLIKHKT